VDFCLNYESYNMSHSVELKWNRRQMQEWAFSNSSPVELES
jgi:hypothetical protein